MYLAINGILPPKEWEHDKLLKTPTGKTVEDALKLSAIPIPN